VNHNGVGVGEFIFKVKGTAVEGGFKRFGNNIESLGYLSTYNALRIGFGTVTPPEGNAIISGDVGIGTATPTAKLEVIGKAIFSDLLTANRGAAINGGLLEATAGAKVTGAQLEALNGATISGGTGLTALNGVNSSAITGSAPNSTGGLTLNAGITSGTSGANQNITLVPSGTGTVQSTKGFFVSGNSTSPNGTAGIDMSFQSTYGKISAINRGTGGANFPLALNPEGGHILLGKTTDNSNGRLQLLQHTTYDKCIAFGTDVSIFRSGEKNLAIRSGEVDAGFFTQNTASGGLYVGALGTNQDIQLVPTGTGWVTSPKHLRITDAALSNTSSEGALVVTGGVGIVGNLNVGTTTQLSGNVGIGGPSSDSKLAVVGDGKITSSLAVNTSGDPNGVLTVGSGTTGNGGNLRLLSTNNSWGVENDSGTLKFFRETAAGTNKLLTASMGTDASILFQGRVSSQGITVTSGGINVQSGDISLNNASIRGVAMPVSATGNEAANVNYVKEQIPFDWNTTTKMVTLKHNNTDLLGLGTVTPAYKLDVFDVNGARLDNLGLGNGLRLKRDVASGGQSWLLGIGIPGGASSAFKISDTIANRDRLTISSAGNVGLGTAAPQAHLHVFAEDLPENTGAQMIISAPQTQGNDHYILFRNNWSTNDRTAGFAAVGFNDAGNGSGKLWFATASTSLSHTNTPTKRMIIDGTGHVGIGVGDSYFANTNNTGYLLSVGGKIHAQEIVVDTTNWSDYVFSDNYRNAPLSEVEAHIKEHKHLPGIPSAQQVAETGVNIGQMQALLLSKVEELTLHMIEQEKRLKRLEEENAALRATH
jgi:hypothetical protein